MTLQCPKCQMPVIVKEKLKIKSDGNFAIHASCIECGAWLKWLPFADSTLVRQALRFYSTLPECKENVI